MPANDEGSVTLWIGDLKAGGDAAAQPIWERYFDRLIRLASAKLRVMHRPEIVEDEEDAVLSAFDSFCQGAARGRFPLLTDRDDLWRLLVVITVRKVQDQLERGRAAKRGGGKVVAESALPGAGSDEPGDGLGQIIGREPTPEFAAMVAEEYQRLRDRLEDDSLRRVLDLRLEGYTREEIAESLGCAQRTVARKLEVIRELWAEEDGG